jgi:hypothetical protein
MRKFFSQKSKQKAHQTTSTLTGSSALIVSPTSCNKDDETQITRKSKPQTTSSHSQSITTNSTDLLNESISSEQKIPNQLKQDENGEKSRKLFVVVSGKYFYLTVSHVYNKY